jgi:UPF0755 protein
VYDAHESEDVQGYEPFPERRRRRGGCLPKLIGLVAVVIVLGLIGFGVLYLGYQRSVDPAGPPGAAVNVTIPLGSSSQQIGAVLASKHVIGSARVFRIYTKLNGGGPFLAGEYAMQRNMSIPEAIAKLKKGPAHKFERLTVPEGLVLGQIAEKVGGLEGRSAAAFLAATKAGSIRSKYQPAEVSTLEGLLLPETYNVEPKDDEARILQRMVQALDQTAQGAGYDDAQAKVGVTPYQAIVVASLIERETRFDDERAKVAEVIYNRLQRKMPLGIDASVIYALGKSAERNVRVLDKDLQINSPYNTYKVQGLPPTPIAAPGRASLEAALHPESGPFLYYVVTHPDGHHSFATTLAEHNANIAKAKAAGLR